MVEPDIKLNAREAIRIAVEFLVLMVLVSIGVTGAFNLGFRLAGLPAGAGKDWGDWGLVIANSLAAIWAVSRALRRHHGSWRLLVIKWSKPAGLVAPFLMTIIGAGILLSFLGNLLEAVVAMPEWLQKLQQDTLDFRLHPVASFLAIVVVAPLTEEIIFRGLVLRGLLGEVSPARAIVVSSTLFAFVHLNPWQLPVVFVAGLVLGWAYLRTRSLGLCVAGHALNNAIVLFSTSLPFEIPGFNTVPRAGETLFQPWWLNLCGLILVVIGATWFHRAAPRTPTSMAPSLPHAATPSGPENPTLAAL